MVLDSKYRRMMFVSIQNDYTGIEASIMFCIKIPWVQSLVDRLDCCRMFGSLHVVGSLGNTFYLSQSSLVEENMVILLLSISSSLTFSLASLPTSITHTTQSFRVF